MNSRENRLLDKEGDGQGGMIFAELGTAHFRRELHKKAKCYPPLILEINKKGIKFLF